MKAFRTSLKLILLTLLFLCAGTPRAWADTRYAVSEKSVLIRIQKDGSADVTERIVYAIKGSVNNLVLAFMKPETGGITFNRLISEGLRGEVVCRPLEAGQWDPTVFSGTYSLYDEPDCLKLRAYYVFGRYRSRFVAQYRIEGAVARHPDCADFLYAPVGEQWPTRVENIHAQVMLPDSDVAWKPEAFLRGVFVGMADVTADGVVSFDIPDTVPGEAPVLRVLFPPNQVPGLPLSSSGQRLDAIRREEAMLRREAEEPALRARENAAREAGQRAFAAIIAYRTRMAAAVLSVLLTLLGTAFSIWVRFCVRAPLPVPPSLPKLSLLVDNPWLARMLLRNGRFDARALLAAWVRASETGAMTGEISGDKQPLIRLRITGMGPTDPHAADPPPQSPADPDPIRHAAVEAFYRRLSEWTALLADEHGLVRLPRQGEALLDPERNAQRGRVWNRLCGSASEAFERCGFNTRIHDRIRRIALAAGMLLVAAALVAGVGLAIPQPYLMALPGLALVWLGMAGCAYNSRAVGFVKTLRQIGRQFRQRRDATASVMTSPLPGEPHPSMTRLPVACRLSLGIALGVERSLTAWPCVEASAVSSDRVNADPTCGLDAADGGIRLLKRSLRKTLRRLGRDVLPAMREAERIPDHA